MKSENIQNRYNYWFKAWILPVLIGLIAFISQALGWVEWLRYERQAVIAGQWWRLLSGNFVHLGWAHYAMNIAGLGLIWAIFKQVQSVRLWMVDVLVSSLAVGLGLYCLNPNLVWYVGLSGLLHGMFVTGLLLDQSQSRGLFLIVLFGFIGKLVWEQLAGALPGSASVAGGAVIVDAHLYGAIGGLCTAAAKRWLCFKRPGYLSS